MCNISKLDPPQNPTPLLLFERQFRDFGEAVRRGRVTCEAIPIAPAMETDESAIAYKDESDRLLVAEFAHEDQNHVFMHDRSGRFVSSCTMTPTALRDAVLAGKADHWNVVYYDQETGEAATICPRCAVGLPCRGSES